MKQRTRSAVKKRFYKTKGGKGKVMRAKANHRHRLIPKSKRIKQMAGKTHSLTSNKQNKTVASFI